MMEKEIKAIGGKTLKQVFLTVPDHIAVVTLNNPPVNAISRVMQEEILKICDYINHDDEICVCVLHSILKTFIVGVDVKLIYQRNLDKDVPHTQ